LTALGFDSRFHWKSAGSKQSVQRNQAVFRSFCCAGLNRLGACQGEGFVSILSQ
jgi:hypothetical protein